MKSIKKEKIFAKHLFLNLSTLCNLDCEVCYGHMNVGSKSNMDIETAKLATDFYYKNRDINYDKHYIMFFGGEPLLNFDIIPEYLDWFERKYKDFKCDFYIFTNGILLDNKKADFFINHKIPLFISYDNDREYLAQMKTGSDKYFDHISSMIKYLITQNPEMVIPYYILHEENIGDLIDYLAEILNMGITRLAITRKMFTKWNNQDMELIMNIVNSFVEKRKISIYIYPEIAASCSNCNPHNILVYPGGDIYDLCIVCGSALHKMKYIGLEELNTFYIGNIYKNHDLQMDIQRKREMIHNTKYSGINSFCPTLSPEIEKIKFLWE